MFPLSFKHNSRPSYPLDYLAASACCNGFTLQVKLTIISRIVSTIHHMYFDQNICSGNNWGVCSDGEGRTGCGQQEEFRACADIAISAQGSSTIGHKNNNNVGSSKKSSWYYNTGRDNGIDTEERKNSFTFKKDSNSYTLSNKNSYSFFSFDLSSGNGEESLFKKAFQRRYKQNAIIKEWF